MTEAIDESTGKIRRAVYAGSFDPPTNGHVYMISEGSRLFDELVVAIGENPDKNYSFGLEERLEFLRAIASDFPNVRVETFSNSYLVDYADHVGADALLRGIRNAEDLLFEQTMRNVNSDMKPHITTIFLMPPRALADLSSSFVKGLVGPENWEKLVSQIVPPAVHAAFQARVAVKKAAEAG